MNPSAPCRRYNFGSIANLNGVLHTNAIRMWAVGSGTASSGWAAYCGWRSARLPPSLPVGCCGRYADHGSSLRVLDGNSLDPGTLRRTSRPARPRAACSPAPAGIWNGPHKDARKALSLGGMDACRIYGVATSNLVGLDIALDAEPRLCRQIMGSVARIWPQWHTACGWR